MSQTQLGLDPKLEAAISYIFGFISGIIIFLLEPKNYFVRFHAMQSTVASLLAFVLSFILPLLTPLWFLIWIVVLIVGVVKSLQGELYKFPLIGDLAAQLTPPPPP
ncbi:MAG: hypothetical protein ABWK01_07355 [Infirmifilum sp.]